MKLNAYIQAQRKSYKEAAQELEVSYVSLYRWINSGVIPRPTVMKKIRDWSNGKVTLNDFAS